MPGLLPLFQEERDGDGREPSPQRLANHSVRIESIHKKLALMPPDASLPAIPPPPLHRTETKKAEADQAEGGGFGGCVGGAYRPIVWGRTIIGIRLESG